MPPLVTYSGVDGAADLQGTLFAGKKFFLVQRVPARSRFVQDVQSNGGKVVKLEAQADYIIADHARSDAPPGSLSYTFIERAIRNGEIPPEEEHQAGRPKGVARPAGSSAPVKGVRTRFTTQDDQDLYEWVKEAEARGIAVKGAELYKQLEAVNDRHTWQSWRERYIKQLAYKPPPASTARPTGPNPPAVQTAARTSPTLSRGAKYTARPTLNDKTTAPRSAAKPLPHLTPQQLDQRAAQVAANTGAMRKLQSRLSPADVEPLIQHTVDAEALPEEYSTVVPDEDEPPTFIGFEQENFDDWLSWAETIQDTPVGKYQLAWDNVAAAYQEHTAAEWRAWYEQVVLPVYMEKEANSEDMPPTARKGQYKAIMRAFGTQGQPVYTTAKRSTDLNPTRATASHRTSVVATSNGVPSPHKTTTTNTAPAATKRDRSESEESHHTALKRQRVEVEDDDVVGTTVPPNLDATDEEAAFTSDNDALVQEQLLQEMQHGGTALTAENLALADAEHNPRTDKRALDIAPDDEDKDQSSFANYLNGIVKIAATKGQVSKDSFEALNEKQEQLDALAQQEEEASTDDEEHSGNQDVDEKQADEEAAAPMTLNGHHIPNLVRTQDVDPTLDLSSPIRPHSPGYIRLLNPDTSPQPPTPSRAAVVVSPSVAESEEEGLVPPRRWKGKGRSSIYAINDTSNHDPFNTETQDPDLDIPSPPHHSNEDDEAYTTAVRDSQQMDEERIVEFCKSYMQRGFDEAEVMDAMFKTSMRSSLCKILLEAILNGGAVPRGIAGIWTEREDAWLEGGDAVRLRRLNEKHGWDECQARMRFLEDYRRDDEEE